MHSLRVAFYQPDIAHNVGAMLRLCACLGMSVDVIFPCGFVWSEAHLRRTAMDYLEKVEVTKHDSFDHFTASSQGRRVILLSVHNSIPYTEYVFQKNDILLVGRETAGVPDSVRSSVHGVVGIPLRPETRSLNVGFALAMVAGEALRQVFNIKDGKEEA